MTSRTEKGRLRRWLIATLGGSLLTGLMRTCRWRLVSGADVEAAYIEARRPVVYVLWHGRLLPCAYHFRDHEFGTMISRNRDGDHITRMIENWGYRVIRGSSSRGGSSALKAVVRFLKSGRAVALTPDGPRGPMQKMKLGSIRAAQLSGVPIIPVAAGASSAWYFGRWDRFLVPKPFASVAVALGAPVEVPRDAGEEEVAVLARELEGRLNALMELVDTAASRRRE